jgi:cell division protease FtsH
VLDCGGGERATDAQAATGGGDDVDAIVTGRALTDKEKVIIPSYADRERAAKEKRRSASIFGSPKPAPST